MPYDGSTEIVQEPFSAGASSRPVNLNPAVNVAAKERKEHKDNRIQQPTTRLTLDQKWELK